VDCSARQLCEFAEMGMVYSTRFLGTKSPRIGLLNIGEEVAKGNELAKQVHKELTAAPHINFVGNIEPKALFRGDVDVVVSDGFVGNVVLKTSEAVASFITSLLREQASSTLSSRLGAFFMRGAFKRLKTTIDANEYPGAILVGIRGTVVILHGSSTARGVANSIRGAVKFVEADINEHIRQAMQELRKTEENIQEELEEQAG